jgi:hypothetical protein
MKSPVVGTLVTTLLWFSIIAPFIVGKLVNDYRLATLTNLCLVPMLVSLYTTLPAIAPFFVMDFRVIIPTFILMYSILMIMAQVSKDVKAFLEAKPGTPTNTMGALWVTVSLVVILVMALALIYGFLPQFADIVGKST